MAYVGFSLFFLCVASQGLLFWRASRWGGWRAYPFFYSYLSYTAFWTIALIPHSYTLYARVYWDSELGAAVLRFLVAWEVFRTTFRPGTVVRKVAGRIILAALLLLVLIFWLSGPSPGLSPIIDFMRKMALAASVWTILVLGIVWFYGIRIGQNIGGMAIGLLAFVSTEIINFSAYDLAKWFLPFWQVIHPLAYVFMLTVWVWSMWDYAPAPQTEFDASLAPQFLSKWQRQSAALNEAIQRVIQP